MSEVQKHKDRYIAALHAMQTGVLHEMRLAEEQAAVSPKQLRVGINAAMADISSITLLLIEKGIFTEEELMDAIATGMEHEKERYEQILSKLYHKPIKLG